MNESLKRSIQQIQVLWPHIEFNERCFWVDVFRREFNDDFVQTVRVLSGQEEA